MVMKKYYDDAFRDLSAFGTSWFMGLITAVSFILGHFELAVYIIIGFVLSYIITTVTRLFYFKARPKKEKYVSMWSKIDASAFPSNHSIRAIYMAVIIGTYFNSLILTIFLVIISLFVAYSRTYIKKHYYKDVIVGLIIGLVMAFVVLMV